jgi:replicative DNA helicase
MEDADWAALADGMGRYSHLPIEWLFKHRHIEDIIAQARWQYERGMCECLIVDYIQMLDTRARFNAAEDRLRVGYISKMLADTAKDLEIPVIGLAQLTRQSGGHSIMPQLSSLKDSGSQEQDADGVILIHEPDWDGDDSLNDREKAIFNGLRDSKSQRLKVFNVAKQRMGEKGTVAAIYDGSRNRFAALER